MALAIAAILTFSFLLVIPCGLIFLEWEAMKRRKHFELTILPKLRAQDAKRFASRTGAA